MISNRKVCRKGFIALTSILIISAVTIAIAMSVALTGIGSANSALGFAKGQGAVKIAESCVEETLLKLRDDGNFSGSTLTVGDGSCTATVSALGNLRNIAITGQIIGPPKYEKLLLASATRIGKSITINSWEEATSTTPAPTNTQAPTPTNTPTPTPTNTPTPTPTPANCNQYCQQKYSLPGSCKKSNQCSGYKEGTIYECSPTNICCCQ